MATVELRGVEKGFAGGFALRGLSLTVAEGECLALVGPSGCGKTTTLRLIAGLERPTRGQILIGGRDVTREPPDRRGVAMVFQGSALYPHMTVLGNMTFGGRLRGVGRGEIEKRARDAASMLGIEALLDRRPGQLSGGERQRAAVGRAIVSGARVLLLDEPLSSLDAPLRGAARADLKAVLARLGVTAVYVTHDQEEAMTIGDRVGVMCAGVLRQCGPGLEVFERPADRFVAGFIGTPAMNLLEGALEAVDGSLWFRERGGEPGLEVAAPHRAALAGRAGGPVTLGLRPASLQKASGSRPERELTVRVRVVEHLGDAANVIASTANGSRVVARFGPGPTPGPMDSLRLEAGMERAYYFEPGEFGRNLLAGS